MVAAGVAGEPADNFSARAEFGWSRREPIGATGQPAGNLGHEAARQREFIHARQRVRTVLVKQCYLVLVAPHRFLCAIGDQQRGLLAAALGFGIVH